MTDVLAPDAAGIATAAAILRDGGLVAFPTDTVYGLGARAGEAAALERIFAAKRRPPDKAIPWLVSSLDEAVAAGYQADARATALAARFWPGALTLVLPAADGSGATQAFRAPDHPVTLALLAASGPLAASSANRSGEPDALEPDDVLVAFADADEPVAVIDGGRVPGGVPSTVVDLSVDPARVVRAGPISAEMLGALIEVEPPR